MVGAWVTTRMRSEADFAFGRKRAGRIPPTRERLVVMSKREPKTDGVADERLMMDMTNVDDRLLHGIVLAAGEGKRLQPYVQEIGGALAKQYVNLIERRSMLDLTVQRRSENAEGHYGTH